MQHIVFELAVGDMVRRTAKMRLRRPALGREAAIHNHKRLAVAHGFAIRERDDEPDLWRIASAVGMRGAREV